MLNLVLNEYLKELERRSLLTKIDLLVARCKPPADWSPIDGYQFDRSRLQRLDELRHKIVHGSGLVEVNPTTEDDFKHFQ